MSPPQNQQVPKVGSEPPLSQLIVPERDCGGPLLFGFGIGSLADLPT